MAEIVLTENPMYPGLPIREELEIVEDTVTETFKVKDKSTGEVLFEMPCHCPVQMT